MVRTCLIILGVTFCFSSNAARATDKSVAPMPQIERGYGTQDACFGDKYETDDDLKTGNELKVQEILKMLIAPGT